MKVWNNLRDVNGVLSQHEFGAFCRAHARLNVSLFLGWNHHDDGTHEEYAGTVRPDFRRIIEEKSGRVGFGIFQFRIVPVNLGTTRKVPNIWGTQVNWTSSFEEENINRPVSYTILNINFSVSYCIAIQFCLFCDEAVTVLYISLLLKLNRLPCVLHKLVSLYSLLLYFLTRNSWHSGRQSCPYLKDY